MRYLLLITALLLFPVTAPSTPAAETTVSGIHIDVYHSPG